MPSVRLGLIKGPKGDRGPRGPEGPQGTAGISGIQGPAGADGITPRLQVGSVATLEAGDEATVTITGTEAAPVLHFGIPKGADAGGNGDMKISVYDQKGRAEDVFDYADTKMPKTGGVFSGQVSGVSLGGDFGGFRNIFFGSAVPSAGLGANGDVYIQTPGNF